MGNSKSILHDVVFDEKDGVPDVPPSVRPQLLTKHVKDGKSCALSTCLLDETTPSTMSGYFSEVAMSGSFSSRVCEERFQMYTVPVGRLLELNLMTPFEECVDAGLARPSCDGDIVFFVSHQWLSFDHPDPDGIQLRCLQKFLSRAQGGQAESMFAGNVWEVLTSGTNASNTYSQETRASIARMTSAGGKALTEEAFAQHATSGDVWLDYFSIPQFVDDEKRAAIESIPSYIERSTYFIVLAPHAKNRSTGEVCNFSSWCSRGWCRLEENVNFLSRHTMTPIVVNEDEKARILDFSDWLHFRAWNRKAAVASGQFACCRLNHVAADGSTIPCDKDAVLKVLRAMWYEKIRFLSSQENQYGYTCVRLCETKMLATDRDEPFHAFWSRRSQVCPESVLAAIDEDIAEGRTTWPAVRLAAALGDERLLELCKRRGEDPRDVNPDNGQSTLILASTSGSVEAVKWLVAQESVDVDFINLQSKGLGISALERAARNGHDEIVNVLVAAGADVNIRRWNGQTPLHAAAENGHEACVRSLIAAGAELDATDDNLDTALHVAAVGFTLYGDWHGKLKLARLLISHGASAEEENMFGLTPLQVAEQEGSPEMAAVLRIQCL